MNDVASFKNGRRIKETCDSERTEPLNIADLKEIWQERIFCCRQRELYLLKYLSVYIGEIF